MNVELYIKELLETENCVIIPKLGGFIANYENSQLLEGAVITMLPPRKKFLFNTEIKVNDGVLINYISVKEEISYDEARQKVEAFVTECQNALNEYGSFSISDFGNFRINKSGKIEFEPNAELGEPIPDSFGLPEIVLPCIQNLAIDDTYVSAPVEVSTRKKLVRRLVLASPIVIALAFIPTHFYNVGVQESAIISIGDTTNKIAECKQSIEKSVVSAEKIDVDTQKLTDLNIVNDDSVKTSLVISEVETTKIEDVPNIPQYYVVMGCFKNERNANKLLKRITNLGYEAQIIETDGLLRVVSQSFDSRSNAKETLAVMKQENDIFADSWVFCSK